MTTAVKQQTKEPEIKATGRSAAYPWIDLEGAVARLDQFWKEEKTYEVPIGSAFKHWGYGAKSSGARLTLAAMLSYGFLADKGSNEKRTAKITKLGIEVVMAPSPEAKIKALKIAAQKPRAFASLLKDMDPQNLPSDQTLAHILVTQRGFNPNATETFIKNFKRTIQYAKLEKSDILSAVEPTQAQVDGDGGLQGKVVNLLDRVAAANAGTPAVKPSGVATHAFKQDVYNFADGGQVILQWPEGMTADSFQEFEEWIDMQKRKIKKASGATPKDKKE